MERNDKIRGNRNLNRWGQIPELMEARVRIRGKERQNPWKQEFESMGTNTRIAGSGNPDSWKGTTKLFTPLAQCGATATAACCITYPSMLHSDPQHIGFFCHPICQWSDSSFSPPLHLFLLRKGDRQISQRKLPAQMIKAMAPPEASWPDVL